MMRLVLTALIAVLLNVNPVQADKPPPFPEFSAKRVKPPSSGTQKRITIQIDPSEQIVSAPKDPEPEKQASASPGRYDWFWDEISPAAENSGPGRLEKAINVMAGATNSVPAPRLQHMQDIASVNGIDILRSTIGTQVSPALVLAVITVESSGKSDAVSSAGAKGLMQLMPATAERFGVKDSFVAQDNIAGGVKYLNWLMDEFDRDPILVLAGYNAGEGSVRKHAGVPPFAETRDYVPKVLAAFQVAKGLCRTPPQLITDGCVFAALN